MKPTILTQKNVCALLGLMMAMTILWSASAEAKDQSFGEVATVKGVNDTIEAKEAFQVLEVDLKDLKVQPTLTFINKYGEVVAEFYGEKSEIEGKFKELVKKGSLLVASGKQEIYLI
ncbi:hypothetical protein A33Q_2431 [Indibacter alkaliphilus LW1]|uniref:Uncharacterized protein n=1 Tax=Indibacter alkaliphilus (strain CCUG 57479 / KCTC 22604 / LW1) TaxID=1189612 RepID=S2DX57_INDAL|nr:hypothetical protein [Indibacter alkaliphilus]EOZ96661.1 hypothetical protein A33Q_2431 [Indibacter alkaliphilus LW1]